MKHFKVLLLTLIVLISGCFSPRPPSSPEDIKYTRYPQSAEPPIAIIPIVIDKNFSEDDKLSIDKSISTWNYVLNGYLILKTQSFNFDMEPEVIKAILDQDGLMIMKINHDNKLVTNHETKIVGENKSITLAWANAIGGNKVWVIRDRIESEDVYHIMLHELGHILGAEHEKEIKENQNLLMYPKYWKGQYYCVDSFAMQKVAMYQNLRPSKLNYCYY